MTLLFFDGFESADVVQKPEWDTATGWHAQTGRTGKAASIQNNLNKILTLSTPAATCVLGIATLVNTSNVLGNTSVAAGISFRVSTTDNLSINWNSVGQLVVRNGGPSGTIIATGTTKFQLNVWYQIQAKVVLSSTATGSIEIRVNGSTVPEIVLTNVITASATGAVSAIRLGAGDSSTSDRCWWDDMYVCDAVDATATQGRPNNDFLGDLKVAQLVPTAAGASTQWTPNTAVANYTTVDDIPPNQTDYVSSSTPGQRDLYEFTDLATQGTIYGVRLGMYAQKSDVGAASLKPVLREGVSGTVTVQTTIALGITWASMWGAPLIQKAAGGVWTVSDINVLQAGVEAA